MRHAFSLVFPTPQILSTKLGGMLKPLSSTGLRQILIRVRVGSIMFRRSIVFQMHADPVF